MGSYRQLKAETGEHASQDWKHGTASLPCSRLPLLPLLTHPLARDTFHKLFASHLLFPPCHYPLEYKPDLSDVGQVVARARNLVLILTGDQCSNVLCFLCSNVLCYLWPSRLRDGALLLNQYHICHLQYPACTRAMNLVCLMDLMEV